MDKKENSILWEAALQALPYVGGSLSTLYFGRKQEKRFERLETFYQELKNEITMLRAEIPDISSHDPDSLTSILEKLHDSLETEHLEEKRNLYKKYYIRTLLFPVNNSNYDQRMIFLQVLKNLNVTQIAVLAFIRKQQSPVIDKAITSPDTSESLIQGSIAQLKILGLIDTKLHGIVIGGANSAMNEQIEISSFGMEFHDFCML